MELSGFSFRSAKQGFTQEDRFTTLTGAVIGFAYWDRRTMIRRAKEEAIEEKEGSGIL